MPRDVSLDVAWLDDGFFGELTAVFDSYFVPERTSETALAHIVDALLDTLEDAERDAVQLCVISGMTFEEAAQMQNRDRPSDGPQVHRRAVQKQLLRALDKLRGLLEGTTWVRVLADGKIPEPSEVSEADEQLAFTLGLPSFPFAREARDA